MRQGQVFNMPEAHPYPFLRRGGGVQNNDVFASIPDYFFECVNAEKNTELSIQPNVVPNVVPVQPNLPFLAGAVFN